jgi:hypothetical protein
METKRQNDLRIGETSPHEFLFVGDLPMNCDILLEQDWLERFGYQFQIPHLGINPYPTAFPYGNGMVLHFYQQQKSSTTKTVHKVINKGLKAYV